MDVRCPKCAEPWDHDELHEYAKEYGVTYAEVNEAFRTKGCGVAFAEWFVTCKPAGREYRATVSLLHELLGDDLDAVNSLLEEGDIAELL